jgi:hypothetical protein
MSRDGETTPAGETAFCDPDAPAAVIGERTED